jgi:uncharacterized protein with HEPN domain
MRHNLGDAARVKHIRDAIREIAELTNGYDQQTFTQDKKTKFASVFQLEIIGEAASRLSEELKLAHQGIAWQPIIGLRHIIVHEYFGIDYDRIWEVISIDLPALEIEIEKIIENL